MRAVEVQEAVERAGVALLRDRYELGQDAGGRQRAQAHEGQQQRWSRTAKHGLDGSCGRSTRGEGPPRRPSPSGVPHTRRGCARRMAPSWHRARLVPSVRADAAVGCYRNGLVKDLDAGATNAAASVGATGTWPCTISGRDAARYWPEV